jgi:hypothetical protein
MRGEGVSEMRIFTDAELTVVLQMIDAASAPKSGNEQTADFRDEISRFLMK